MTKPIGVIADKVFFEHRIDQPVRENPGRLRPLYCELEDPLYKNIMLEVTPRCATAAELELVHSQLHIDQVRHYCLADSPNAYDKDTYLMEDSFYVASMAAGSCLELCDALMEKRIDQAFALIRPPGHHAEPGRGMGFCIFNNVAIAARYLQQKHNLKRILIFDFDAHHGNGTQQAFYGDSGVLFLSIHERGLFPAFTGGVKEYGEGSGLGYNLNIPVYPRYGDIEYYYLLGRVVQEVIDQYQPQAILVSAGFDGHADDSISDLRLTTFFYQQLTTMLRLNTVKHCSIGLLYILEGGYESTVLTECTKATLSTMAAALPQEVSFPFSRRAADFYHTELVPVFSEKWMLG